MEKLRVGVIGVGSMGRHHARVYSQMSDVDFVGVSDVDKKALHVRLAEEAYPLGASSPSESYLNIEKILNIAKKCRAEALHPGYGFLAENPELVKHCEKEGIHFIGPSIISISPK